jgi:hypothetical protein
MSFSLIACIIVIGAFAAWGIALMRSKIVEKPSQTSSHYGSKSGQYGGGH